MGALFFGTPLVSMKFNQVKSMLDNKLVKNYIRGMEK